ncbi:MAG: hypothetical protein ACYC8T_10175 [Myxococcaceae bacterium]
MSSVLRAALLLATLWSLSPAPAIAAHPRWLLAPSPEVSGPRLLAAANTFPSARLLSTPASGDRAMAQALSPPPPPPAAPAPTPPPLPEADVPQAEAPESSSHSELRAEYAELEANNPDLVVPIVLEVGAEVAAGVGYLFAVFGFGLGASELSIAGTAIFLGGLALAIVGTVLIVKAVIGRVQRMRRMNEIDELLNPPPGQPGSLPSMQLTLARF